VMAAVWSAKASIKDQDDVFFPFVIGKAYLFVLSIG
jgi:hypothetical protein